MKKNSFFKCYGFVCVTAVFFAASLVLHWLFGWFAYADEQEALKQPVDVAGYLHEMLRDTFENWQSEFLQLIWQVAGLAFLLHVGSPQSKEGDDRMEAKLDAILLAIDPVKAKEILLKIDDQYEGRHTDPYYKQLSEN